MTNPTGRRTGGPFTKGPTFVVLLVILAGAYVLAAKAGLALAFVNPSATAVWPPTGITIAANLIFGYAVWPAFLVGAFVANVTTSGSMATSLAIAVGNTLEGLVGAWFINRLAKGRFAFQTPSGVFKFALLAAVLAPVASATIGVTSLAVGGYARWADYGAVWATWWLGDASGALIVAPLLVLWSQRSGVRWPKLRWLETGCFVVALAAVSQVVFDSFDVDLAQKYPLDFLCIPVLVWAAFRLGPRMTATAVCALSATAVWGTWRGLGPFAGNQPNVSLLLLQLFLGVLAVTSLAVAAAVEARNCAEEERDRLLVAEQEARGRAEAAIQARDQFLSVASHELKTPVTALKAAADLSLRRQARGALDADSLGRTFALIQKTSGRLASLIDDLLDVSRMRTGHMPLSCGELDLGLLVSRAVEQARDQFGEHHAFTADISCPPNLAWGDADRLEQVLTNLLENAVKYSPTGGEVTLQLQPDAAGLLLTVRDTGIGLPAGAEEVVFEPFGRASNATANRVPGMGLGLYICRDIVQRHGGRIWVESPGEGQGTTAFVWLPRGPVEVAVPAGAIPDHSGDEPEMHVPVEQRRQDQQP